MAYRGYIENGAVVLDEPVDVLEGTAVTVESLVSVSVPVIPVTRIP